MFGLLYLFLKAVFHHAAGLLSIGSTGATYMPERLRSKFGLKPETRRLTLSIAGILLYVAFYQAWVDEHDNTKQVISERAAAVSELEFWKKQNYAKDQTIREKDNLLEQNITVLSTTQTAFANLSNKILDVSKPEPLIITTKTLNLPITSHDVATGKTVQLAIVIAQTNKAITPVRMRIECSSPFDVLSASIAGENWQTETGRDKVSPTVAMINIDSPAWRPYAPVVWVISAAKTPDKCEVAQRN